MNRIILFALVAGMSTSAFGQNALTFGSMKPKTTHGLVSRGQNAVTTLQKQDGTFTVNNVRKISQVGKARVLKAGETQNKYGTEVVKMYEDFSKMSTGSIDAPDFDTDINYNHPDGIWWWNVKPEYTTLPNWGAHYAYPAGGCLFLDADNEEGAQLNTPLIDLSDHCRIAVIQFRARTKTGTTTQLMVEAAETYNMSPTGWDNMEPVYLPEITPEWKTYEVMFKGTGASTMFNLVQYPAVQIFIDDIKVYQIDQYIDTPVTLAHSNYTNEGFTANWEAVDGAEYYLINVYSLDADGKVVDLLVDQKAEGTSYNVTGIESGKTYYYTLRAVKGDKISIETLPVEVFDLAAPVLNKASEVVDDKYTATWSEVASAERYNYWAYNVRKADTDGEFVVTNENFDGVTDADGNLTGLTIDNPSYLTYGELYIKEFVQAGWRGTNCMPYTDYYCFDGWQYMNGQGDAGLISPELDLSKDNGKVNLSVRLCGEIADLFKEDGTPVPTQTRCAVALFNYDEEKGDYVQSELVYPEGVSTEWNTFDVTLTKGTKRSTIGIYAVSAPGNLYVDDLKITQNYKKGEELMEPFFFGHWVEGTSIEVSVPAQVVNSPIYHKVNAVKSRSGSDPYGGAEYKESAYSSLEKVTDNDTSTGIEGTTLNEAAGAVVNNGVLFITNPAKANVAVYAVDGTLVYSDNSGKQSPVVSLAGRGIYVVKIGKTVVKVRN